MPNTFRPRGAPTAETNAYVDSYNDWDLVHRGAMAPWGVYEKDGQTSAGFAWPSMITEPIEAGKRFLSPGGGFENLPNEQSTQDATTLLLSMYGGNALNPATALPKNALGMFAGRKAATADHQALALAERLAAEGADRNSIWNETGWFQGPDKQWRFEIDDSKARINNLDDMVPDAYSSLDYVLAHPELSQSYPDIMDNTSLTANAFPAPYQNAGAAHVTDLDTIMINSGRDDWKDKALTNLLHETQHQIQKNEGFHGGGSRTTIPADLIAQERARIGAVPNENSWSVVDNAPGDMTDDQIAWSLYRRLPGEVEARNVQRRANMDADTRKAFPPWETQDIPYEDQIVRMGNGGPQYSMSEPKNALAAGAVKAGTTALPMDQASRLARAKDMGFDTDNVWYHGTPHKFQSFGPGPHRVGTGGGDIGHPMSEHGVFFTPDKSIASLYGPNIHEVYIRPGTQEKYYDNIADPEAINRQAENLSSAKSRGADTVVLGDHNPRVAPEVVVFDPSRIRHTNAAFDPSYIDSKGLFLSDTGKPSLLGSALAGAQGERPWWER